MDHSKSLLVSTRELLFLSGLSGWQACCMRILAALAGDAEANGISAHELMARLPPSFDYRVLREKVAAEQVLDLVDSLEDRSHMKTSGHLLLAMVRRFFLPNLPADHPGYAPTLSLLSTLSDYLNGVVPAESYIGAAFLYRSQYGTTITAAGTDSVFEYLFEAMPSNGLDCPIGENSWHTASHWRSFGRFMASQRDTWRLLDVIDDELDYQTLLSDPAADCEATEAVRSKIIDPQRDAMVEIALEEFASDIESLVDAHFPVTL